MIKKITARETILARRGRGGDMGLSAHFIHGLQHKSNAELRIQ